MSQPIKTKLFVWSDALFVGMNLVTLGFAIGAMFTDNPMVGKLIMWGVALGGILVTTTMLLSRKKQLQWLRYTAKGMIVAWRDEGCAVKDADFEAAVDEVLSKVSKMYPNAQVALNGCLVFFTDPTFFTWTPGYAVRRVAGIQNGSEIVVGWNRDVKQTALEHELGHRVLQVYANDPIEEIAHRILAQMGL